MMIAMKRLFLMFLSLSLAVVSLAQQPYSVRMIRSEMKRNPDATYLDGRNGERKWNYTTGLEPVSYTHLTLPTMAVV